MEERTDCMKMKAKFWMSLFALIAMGCQPIYAIETSGEIGSQDAGVLQLVEQLENADGSIPESFTKDDMDAFLAEADPAVVSEILNRICENAEAVPTPTEQSSDACSATYTEYDPQTGIQTTHRFSDLPEASDAATVSTAEEMLAGKAGINVLRAYPDYWFEVSPQIYADTRSTCKLIIKTKGYGDYVGTGFLVSNDTLLTASHCIYNTKFGGWMDYMIVMPSYGDSYTSGYYGSRTSSTVYVGNYLILPSNYLGDDWGLVKLNSAFSIGYLSIVTYRSNSHVNRWIRVQGYPGSNPQTGASGNKTMYLTTGVGATDKSDYLKDGTAKVYSGMSGGPVLTYSSGTYYAAGIISSYYTSTHNVIYVAFDENLCNLIKSYS